MPLGIIHYLHWPTASTYPCGANAVGRRNTAVDTKAANTSCAHCLKHPGHPGQNPPAEPAPAGQTSRPDLVSA